MKVYPVLHWYTYESCEVVGVFTSWDKASEGITTYFSEFTDQEHRSMKDYDDIEVTEEELDYP